MAPTVRYIVSGGATILALSVILGAFGAHGLRERLGPALTTVWEKAVLYQFIHAFAILIIPCLISLSAISERAGLRITLLFTLGIFLFSGSLYALCLTSIKSLGIITPFGGTLFIVAWFMLAYSSWKGAI